MNKVQRIDDFLKLLACGFENNIDLNKKVVYANLVQLGVKDKRTDISNYFNTWIEHFKSDKNTNVFVSSSWNYFCQFKGANFRKITPYSAIKLYIPLDKEHIKDGVIKLFEFMSEQNIDHVSKVGKRIRFDDVVIRVDNQKNADKIIEFVNNDPYLKEGLLQASPFAHSFDNISISWDGVLSYNEVVSDWIGEYINFERINNNLENVGYSRFVAFVTVKYNYLFNEGIGLIELFNRLVDNKIFDYYDDISNSLLNYRDITALMLSNLDLEKNVSKNELYDYVKKMADCKYQDKESLKICEMYHTNSNVRVDVQPLELKLDYVENLPIGEYQNIQTDAIKQSYDKERKFDFTEEQKMNLKLAFDYMCQKYGYDDTKEQFISYMKDGNIRKITSYNGARNLIRDNGLTKEIVSKIVLYWKYEGLFDAMRMTYEKYGYLQLQEAVYYMIQKDDFSRFTNDNGCRKELKQRFSDDFSKDIVKEILIVEGYDVNVSDKEIMDLILEVFLDKNSKKTIHL